MKMKRIAHYILALTLLSGIVSCDNPLKDFNLLISTEVIKHSTTLEVLDTNGQPVNATIKLLGGDTQDIYNISGYKDFKLVSNLVNFGVDPKREPTAAEPIRFQVEIAATGYITQVVDVSISDANNGIMHIRLAKPVSVPDGAVVVNKTFGIDATGALPAESKIEVAGEEGVNIDITIPQGTQFIGADGKVIVGKALTVSATGFDPQDPNALALFPGGRYQADGVTLANGSSASGTFNPAATTTINMVIDGVPVRQFSKPIAIEMEISEGFTLANGAPLTAGTMLSTFSNSAYDPTWTHEQDTPIKSSGSGYSVAFQVSHLTTFLAGEFVESCSPVSLINFSADWIEQGFTYPVNVEAVQNGLVIASRTYSISNNTKSIGMDYLPASGVQIVVRSTVNNSIIAQAALAACGSATNITIPNPNPVVEPKVTLQLYVRCPDKTDPITLLPTFQLYYRVAGTGAFQYLGAVNNGFLSTSLLKSDGTKYDFRAVWKERTKTVNAKSVQADNSGTVGIKPGDILGEKAGATNLGILIEECNKL